MKRQRIKCDMKRSCRLCLIRDIDPAEYEAKIKRILDNMEPSEKAASSLYENRLGICQACDYLNSGTCTACGCFVELRAARKNGRCPYSKWKTLLNGN